MLYQTHKEKVAIYIVYILEAHPTDGGNSPPKGTFGVQVEQPKTYEKRTKVAGDCLKALKLSIPCLVDNIDNTAQKAYAGWPDRLYAIDQEGKIAYKGEEGPRGFKPAEAEAALRKLIE